MSAGTHNTVNQLTARTATGPIRVAGTLTEPGTVTVNGQPAAVAADNTFTADVPLAPGTQTVAVVAKDYSNNTKTQNYQVTVAGGTARTLAYDLNGNLLNDGAGKTYTWDAANRLKTITQGTNVTEFVYNGAGQRVQEKLNGTLIKQWLWAGGAQPAEERDAANNVTKRFCGSGQQIAGVNYFHTTDHLGSVREMTDGAGTVRARYDYDPYGRITKVSGDLEADFGFTGHYRHQASGLNLTLFRAYDPELGRWLSREPLGELGPDGPNVYAYVQNNPINGYDPDGLFSSLKTAPGAAVMMWMLTPEWANAPGPGDTPHDPTANSDLQGGALCAAGLGLAGKVLSPVFRGLSEKFTSWFRSQNQRVPLQRIHSDDLIKNGADSNYRELLDKSTKELVDSLKPGLRDSLKVKPDGRIMDGNTRTLILQERGYDINKLPRDNWDDIVRGGGQ